MAGRRQTKSTAKLTPLVRELESVHGDLTALLRLVGSARSLFRASDVSVALHDPRMEAAAPGCPWFAQGLPAGISGCLRDPMEGHLPLRALRRLGLPTTRLDQLPGAMTDYGRGSAYARTLAAAGRARVLLGHVGDRQSLGRIEWYRPAEQQAFTEDDETRLRLILPALAAAYRSLHAQVDQGDVALINAAGQVLWSSDGFRFQWRAAGAPGIQEGRLPLAAMLDDPMFGRPVALQVLNLADPVGIKTASKVEGPSGARRDHPVAKWAAYPGGPYGCVGRVMLLQLYRSVRRGDTPQPGRPSPHPVVERRRTSGR